MKAPEEWISSATTIASTLLLTVAGTSMAAGPALTIYNQNFAVVRDTVELDLKPGVNEVNAAGMTAYVEPASVILRDPAGTHGFRILEQNYRADPVSQELLLSLYEGKTIRFESFPYSQSAPRYFSGRIIRSGYTLPTRQGTGFSSRNVQPLIEVDGELRFGLPGNPLFPALTDNTILTPTLNWTIETETAARFAAELSYITDQLSWNADYNLVLPEEGDTLDLSGWVTIDNESGKSFADARIKLMAGDVSKLREAVPRIASNLGGYGGGGPARLPVTEKTFDEYHLYTLEHSTTLLDAQKKQVEFIRAEGIKSKVYYTYDGADLSAYGDWQAQELNMDSTYGLAVNKKVAVTREFENTEANHLGLPLPKGRVRVYRRDADGRLEFTGENEIDHTPRDETVRLNTGYAFDLVGDRKRTHINVHQGPYPTTFATDPATGRPVAIPGNQQTTEPPFVDESFEISLRNRKKEPAEIRVIEHLYRGSNWVIQRPSDEFTKLDSRTIQFRVTLAPGEQKKIEYTVHYTWN